MAQKFYITISSQKKIVLNRNLLIFQGAEFLIDSKTGLLNKVIMNNQAIDLDQKFFYYEGFVGDNAKFINRSSGAYIFRPTDKARSVAETTKFAIFMGNLVSEVHQEFNEWVSQVIRVYADQSLVEFDWLIGPIPNK